MAEDIASLLAQSGRVDLSSFDPSAIVDNYRKGKEYRYQQDGHELFKDGVPTNADGSLNYGAMRDVLFKRGDLDKGLALDSLSLQRQQLMREQEGALFSTGAPTGGSSSLPPSPSRNAGTTVAPPLGQRNGGASSPQGDQQGSIVGMVSGAGIPDELAGPIINQVAAITRTDPNATIDPKIAPRVQQIIAAAVQRQRSGGSQASAPPQVQATAPATQQQASPFQPAVEQGLIPPNRDPREFVTGLALRARTLPKGPAQASIQSQLEAIQKSVSDANNAENAAKMKVVTDFSLPQLKESRDKASAAVNEIQAIHTAREQLDALGGINAGLLADGSQMLQKVGAVFGLPNDRVANTETFKAAISQRVLDIAKQLGTGSGISNADVIFAKDLAGGNIKLDESSIRRILDIGEKIARTRIEKHNKYADKIVNSNSYLSDQADVVRLDMPPAYQRPKQSAAAAQTSSPAASTGPKTWTEQFSSPAAAKAAGAKSGDIITGPDGKPWRVR